MNQDIWTIIQTYSFVQGYLMAGYTFVYLKRSFLSALLLIISTLILAHLYYHFAWYFTAPHFIFSEASLWYMVGPLFYFFVLHHFNRPIRWIHALHFIPFIAFLIIIVPFYLYTGNEKLEVLNSIFGRESYQQDINRYLFTAHIFVYIIVTLVTFNKESQKLKQISSKSTLILDNLLSFALKYYLIFSFFGFLAYLIVGRNYEQSRIYYEFYYIGLSLLIHFIFYYSLLRSNTDVNLPGDSMNETDDKSKKYESSPLSIDELEDIIDRVSNYISRFEVYKNPELRLRMVSDELGIPAHHISQAINQKINKSFFDIINEQRIEGLKRNIRDPKFLNYTLIGIASEHGFKSPSSFYRIFKKYTGKTPKEYFGSMV